MGRLTGRLNEIGRLAGVRKSEKGKLNPVSRTGARESLNVVVIGAGSAGLATSYFLGKLGIEHVILERGEIANTWITERWDEFHLVNPNWAVRLPGFHYTGTDPGGYLSKTRRSNICATTPGVSAPPCGPARKLRRSPVTETNMCFLRRTVKRWRLDALWLRPVRSAYRRFLRSVRGFRIPLTRCIRRSTATKRHLPKARCLSLAPDNPGHR